MAFQVRFLKCFFFGLTHVCQNHMHVEIYTLAHVWRTLPCWEVQGACRLQLACHAQTSLSGSNFIAIEMKIKIKPYTLLLLNGSCQSGKEFVTTQERDCGGLTSWLTVVNSKNRLTVVKSKNKIPSHLSLCFF